MAESGEESEEYRNFLKQPSGNMDDSGFFSIQVISKALQVYTAGRKLLVVVYHYSRFSTF